LAAATLRRCGPKFGWQAEAREERRVAEQGNAAQLGPGGGQHDDGEGTV
jgi:hypothetical protein